MTDIYRTKTKKGIEYYNAVTHELSKNFDIREINGEQCFYDDRTNNYFKVKVLPQCMNALVVEYADNLTEAKKNRFEDGDLFFVEDMTKFEMFNEIMEEIQGL